MCKSWDFTLENCHKDKSVWFGLIKVRHRRLFVKFFPETVLVCPMPSPPFQSFENLNKVDCEEFLTVKNCFIFNVNIAKSVSNQIRGCITVTSAFCAVICIDIWTTAVTTVKKTSSIIVFIITVSITVKIWISTT